MGEGSEANYIDQTTERREELLEGQPVSQGVRAQLQTGGETEAEETQPQAPEGQGWWVQAQAEVHTSHLVNLRIQAFETSHEATLQVRKLRAEL